MGGHQTSAISFDSSRFGKLVLLTVKNQQNKDTYALLISIDNYKYASIKCVFSSGCKVNMEKIRCWCDKDSATIRMRDLLYVKKNNSACKQIRSLFLNDHHQYAHV